ncbi:MAG: hypothetical protein ABIQ64_01155 [Candidatus Saccharimonadales bacterium]
MTTSTDQRMRTVGVKKIIGALGKLRRHEDGTVLINIFTNSYTTPVSDETPFFWTFRFPDTQQINVIVVYNLDTEELILHGMGRNKDDMQPVQMPDGKDFEIIGWPFREERVLKIDDIIDYPGLKSSLMVELGLKPKPDRKI